MHHPVYELRYCRIVGYDDDGYAETAVQGFQHLEYQHGVGGVQLAGRFVGQQQGRLVGKGDANGGPLLFAAGKLMGHPTCLVCYAQGVHQCAGPFAAATPGLSGQSHGELDIVGYAQIRQQVAGSRLPYKADILSPVLDQAPVGYVQEVPLAYPDLPCRRPVEACQDVQQGALAAAAGPDDGD